MTAEQWLAKQDLIQCPMRARITQAQCATQRQHAAANPSYRETCFTCHRYEGSKPTKGRCQFCGRVLSDRGDYYCGKHRHPKSRIGDFSGT